ncbi:small integral membrane protein 20 isoform X1 [Pelecanus crispus]|uniref:small integral membrane protein 20 isoform X1 n=1 Tax=Pelecanus crispus TaxID=36300 RepID=UPI003F5D4155
MAGLSRTLGIFGGFVAVVGAAFYPIYFRPLLLPEEYKKEQSINRAGIVQEDIQPADQDLTYSHFSLCAAKDSDQLDQNLPLTDDDRIS